MSLSATWTCSTLLKTSTSSTFESVLIYTLTTHYMNDLKYGDHMIHVLMVQRINVMEFFCDLDTSVTLDVLSYSTIVYCAIILNLPQQLCQFH